MERSTVSGKSIADWGLRIADLSTRDGSDQRAGFLGAEQIANPKSQVRHRQKGFSLLELMIAMFILIILLSVAFPTYQRTIQHARETVLKENLWQMRRAIDQFKADKQKLPQSVDELVKEKYLQEIPVDPIEEKAEWSPEMGEDDLAPDGGQ